MLLQKLHRYGLQRLAFAVKTTDNFNFMHDKRLGCLRDDIGSIVLYINELELDNGTALSANLVSDLLVIEQVHSD
jgi:hypothetical protein